ncbi:MAG: T9SS type A sorting domain-containing protein [Adhaeribacter sp.]
MKTLFASLLFALTLTTSSNSFATANRTYDHGQTETAAPVAVTFAQIEKSKLDVVVQNAINSNMSIRLTDAAGKNIATKILQKKATGTRVRFDLANLHDGTYFVRVGNGKNTQVKKFAIKTTLPTQDYYQEVTFI